MKTLLALLFWAGILMAGDVKLVNDNYIFPVQFQIVVDDFRKTIEVPPKQFQVVTLAKELVHEPLENIVKITANTDSLLPDVCCRPQFTVADLNNHNFIITFEGTDFRFTRCIVTEGP